MPETKPAAKRYRANVGLRYTPKSKPKSEHRHWKEGEECVGAPDNWPPRQVIDDGWVTEIDDNDPSTQPYAKKGGNN